MKKHQRLTLVLVVLAALCAPRMRADIVNDFDTSPAGGTLADVAAGTTVGWGYHLDLTLDPGHWFEATGVSDSGFPLGAGTPSSAVFDFPITNSSTLDVAWIEGTAGLYEFSWDPAAFAQTVSGTFTMTGRFWDGVPYAPDSTPLDEFTLETPFSTSTTPDQPAITPEPGYFLLLGAGLAFAAIQRRRRLRGVQRIR